MPKCNHLLCILFLFYLIVVVVGNGNFASRKPLWNATELDKLRSSLLLTYDKFARPSYHNSTTVKISITITHLDLDEIKGTMTANGMLSLIWEDEKLKWDPADFAGITVVRMASHELWQPDIVLYNSAAGSVLDYHGNTYFLLYPNGEILWVPPFEYVVFCQLNLLLWPFDTQVCQLKLGSWTHDGTEIDLQFGQNVYKELLIENSEWEIQDITRLRNEEYLSCCEEPRVTITFETTVKRRSPTYKAIIITPAFTIIIMTLLNFWLPPQASEKIILNASTAIVICIFMLHFVQKCSVMGNHTPLIVLFYSSCLYVVTCSLIGSVCVIWLSKTQHHRALPWTLKKPLTGWLGRWLALNNYIRQTSISNARIPVVEELREHQNTFDDQNNSDEHQIIPPSRIPEPCQADWILLAAAIDRISFLFYSLLFAILAIVYAV